MKTLPEKVRRSLNGDGFVYLFRLGEFHKIGCASNVDERMRHFTKLPYESALVHRFPSLDAFGVEKALHRHFVRKRCKGEWFRLDEEDVAVVCAIARADTTDDLPPEIRPVTLGRGKSINVWINDDLRDAIGRVASRSGRSLTAEVSIALERHLEAEGLWPPPPEKKGPAK